MHGLDAKVLANSRGDAAQQMIIGVTKRAARFPDYLAHTSMMLA
jgi:hypothetical protein